MYGRIQGADHGDPGAGADLSIAVKQSDFAMLQCLLFAPASAIFRKMNYSTLVQHCVYNGE